MEIKNITKYNEELLKKFLKVYYFDKIKTVRIINLSFSFPLQPIKDSLPRYF